MIKRFTHSTETDRVLCEGYAVNRPAAEIAAALGCAVHVITYRARVLGLVDPERRRLASRESMRKLNADPEFAAKHAERSRERMRKRHADPEFAAKHAERMRKLNADPEFAAKRLAGLRKHFADRKAQACGASAE